MDIKFNLKFILHAGSYDEVAFEDFFDLIALELWFLFLRHLGLLFVH